MSNQPDYLLVKQVLAVLTKHLGSRDKTRALLRDLQQQPLIVGNQPVTDLLWVFLNAT